MPVIGKIVNMARNNAIGENYMLLQVEWFKTKTVTIDGKKVEIPIVYDKRMIGVYPSYEEALFILKRTQGNYRWECSKGNKPFIAQYSIRRTGKPVTTKKVGKYLSLTEVK